MSNDHLPVPRVLTSLKSDSWNLRLVADVAEPCSMWPDANPPDDEAPDEGFIAFMTAACACASLAAMLVEMTRVQHGGVSMRRQCFNLCYPWLS